MTCVPGLEAVLADEIYVKLGWPAIVQRGMVLATATDGDWKQLCCADNVYRVLGNGEVGPNKAYLSALAEWAVACVRTDGQLLHMLQQPSLRVTASRKGKHSYSRFDAAMAVETGLVDALGWRHGDETRHDVALRLDIDHDKVMLSEKCSDAAFRFRGERQFVSGALRPTLAHALVWLTHPDPRDMFVDPFCGSGTVALERAAYPSASITGIDLDDERLAIARQNDRSNAVHWLQGDALQLPLEAESIDAVVTNPPWGMQLEAPQALCDRFLQSLQPHMKAGGRVILLQPFEPTQKGWTICKLHTVSLHGTLVGVYSCVID